MNEILEKILNEIQGLKDEMILRFKEQDDRIAIEFKKIYERLDKVDARLDKVDARLDKVDARLDKVDARLDKVDDRFDRQTKELAQELRTMADFIYERDKKLFEKLEKKLDEEIKYDRIMLKAHEARINKLEVHQEVLESKFYDLAASKKVG